MSSSFIPISALLGDNVVERWRPSRLVRRADAAGAPRDRQTLTPRIDTVHFRMPVQLVVSPGCGASVGMPARSPQERSGRVTRSWRCRRDSARRWNGSQPSTATSIVAGPGRAVTVTLADEIDISRGDLLVTPGGEPQRAHDLDAMVVWMAEAGAEPGSSYLLQAANAVSNCTIRSIRHRSRHQHRRT